MEMKIFRGTNSLEIAKMEAAMNDWLKTLPPAPTVHHTDTGLLLARRRAVGDRDRVLGRRQAALPLPACRRAGRSLLMNHRRIASAVAPPL